MNSLVMRLILNPKYQLERNYLYSRLLSCFWELPLLWLILAIGAMATVAAMVTEAMVMVVMEVMAEDIMEREMLRL